ncbi:MAG: hypothetical protein ACQES5_01635 [Thermodesulfobacteriota bacterium]
MSNNNARVRVLTCLQTILELEDAVARLPVDVDISRELKQIKTMVDRIWEIRMDEDDVLRIEQATESFLEEISRPLQQTGMARLNRGFVQ